MARDSETTDFVERRVKSAQGEDLVKLSKEYGWIESTNAETGEKKTSVSISETFIPKVKLDFSIPADVVGMKKGSPDIRIRFNRNPFHIAIKVGILDERGNDDTGRYHQDWHGDNVLYTELFEFLKDVGYDPLLPARLPEYKNVVERKMGEILARIVGRTRDNRSVRTSLETLAMRVEDMVKNYIMGGNKPPLSKTTIKIRKRREASNPGLYKEGISEPLYETGEICNNITAVVVGTIDYDLIYKEFLKNIKRRVSSRNMVTMEMLKYPEALKLEGEKLYKELSRKKSLNIKRNIKSIARIYSLSGALDVATKMEARKYREERMALRKSTDPSIWKHALHWTNTGFDAKQNAYLRSIQREVNKLRKLYPGADERSFYNDMLFRNNFYKELARRNVSREFIQKIAMADKIMALERKYDTLFRLQEARQYWSEIAASLGRFVSK